MVNIDYLRSAIILNSSRLLERKTELKLPNGDISLRQIEKFPQHDRKRIMSANIRWLLSCNSVIEELSVHV